MADSRRRGPSSRRSAALIFRPGFSRGPLPVRPDFRQTPAHASSLAGLQGGSRGVLGIGHGVGRGVQGGGGGALDVARALIAQTVPQGPEAPPVLPPPAPQLPAQPIANPALDAGTFGSGPASGNFNTPPPLPAGTNVFAASASPDVQAILAPDQQTALFQALLKRGAGF